MQEKVNFIMDGSIIFTDVNSQKILKLEEDIAYFYGANKPELIATHYIKGLQSLEIGAYDQMQLYLSDAYAEVQNQTSLKFNIEKASKYEFSLILAQGKEAPFEEICDIMVNLYKEVFGCDNCFIYKAAMLRTFLYQYKIKVLRADKIILDNDIALMLSLAKASEQMLAMAQKESLE